MTKYKIGELVKSERKAVLTKDVDWETYHSSDDASSTSQAVSQSSSKSRIIPILLGILATIMYRTYFQD
ncbi:unnamed protein product [Phaedon cochleariae]|uniref:Uncharacterized protein n=1 Tax=Phaedon cochleariae TaxID=80249 RepID=A0A9P0DAX8_PHACE|nr:unnamed protein product [Phaedon cochleariae]